MEMEIQIWGNICVIIGIDVYRVIGVDKGINIDLGLDKDVDIDKLLSHLKQS